MHKSMSAPSLLSLVTTPPHHIPTPPHATIRRNVSTNAFITPQLASGLDTAAAVMMTKAPLNQALSCLVSYDFPDHLLVDEQLISCMMSPCDSTVCEEDWLVNEKSYLQLAVDEEKWRERYSVWMNRVRKNKSQS